MGVHDLMGSQAYHQQPFDRCSSVNTIKEVVFRIFCQTRPGQEVRVVGSVERLGCWDPSRAFRLATSSCEYPYWRSIPTLFVAPAKKGKVEFKIIIVNSTGEVEWEDNANRIYNLSGGHDTVLLHATYGVNGTREIPQRLRPDKTSLVRRQSESLLCRHNSVSSTSFALLRDAQVDTPRDSRTLDARACQSSHWANVGATGRQLTRSESSDQLNVGVPNASVMIVMNSAANWIDVVGTFTDPPWKVQVPMYQDPTNPRSFWLELDKEFPDLAPGSYEFKFLLDSKWWECSPFFPMTSTTSTNNILHIDYRLVERIKRFQSTKPKAASSMTRSQPNPSPVRSVSTAERLFESGTHSPERLPATRASDDFLVARRIRSTAQFWPESVTPGLYTGDVPLLAAELPAVHSSKGLRLKVGAYMTPKDSSGGEDAYAFDAGRCIGVADGVGSMQYVLGHSSKRFAQDLCDYIADASRRGFTAELESRVKSGDSPPSELAKQALDSAFRQTTSHGAATAVTCVLDPDSRRLGIAWIGDSGIMIVRRPTKQRPVPIGEMSGDATVSRSRVSMVYKTKEQQHSFNFPFQLSHFPEEFSEHVLQKPNGPEDCSCKDIELQEGDLVLVYTDGVCDNLFEHEILEICNRALSPYSARLIANPGAATSASIVAESLVTAAYHRSRDSNARTPFGRHAKMNGFPTWERGGKEDDITVVAAWVVSELTPPPQLEVT